MKTIFYFILCGLVLSSIQKSFADDALISWKFETDGSVYATPVIEDSIMYIGSLDSCFYAINAITGEPIWKYQTTNQIRTTVAVYDSILCFASGEKLIGLSKSGNLLWEFLLCSQPFSNNHDAWDDFNSSPLLVDSIAYVGSDYGLLFGVNVITGDTAFHYQTPSAAYTIETKPVYHNGKVYFGDWDGVFFCVDLQTADTLWTYDTKNDNTYSWVNAVQTNSVIYEDQVLFAGRSCNLYSLNLETGAKKWMFHDAGSMWILGGLVLKDTLVFAGSSNQFMFQCFDVRTGSRLWTTPVDYRIYGSPYVTEDYYIVGTGMEYTDPFGSLILIAASDNKKLAKIETGGQVHSSPVLSDSTIYFGCADGSIYAVSFKAMLNLKYPHTCLEDNSVIDLGELPNSEVYSTDVTLINDGEASDSVSVVCSKEFVELSPAAFLLEAGASQDVTMDIDLPQMDPNYYTISLLFKSFRALDGANFSKRYTFTVVDVTGIGDNMRQGNTNLDQNYPNPFSEETIIPLNLRNGGHSVLSLYDARGVLVDVLYNNFLPAGRHEIKLHASTLQAGIYFCRLITDSVQQSITLNVIK